MHPEGVRYEDVEIPIQDGLVWYPWHSWRAGETTWVDGVLKRPEDEFSRPLDIATTRDSHIGPIHRLAAEVAWSQGTVLIVTLHGVNVVVIPGVGLTVELMHGALSRAQQCDALPALREPLPH